MNSCLILPFERNKLRRPHLNSGPLSVLKTLGLEKSFIEFSKTSPLNYVYYVPNRHYREAVGIKMLAHDLVTFVTFGNISDGLPKNRKLDTVTL